jgi:hypothetical protein
MFLPYIGILLVWIDFTTAFTPGRSLEPLKYIQPNLLLQFGSEKVEQVLVNAVLPQDFSDAISIAVSEGASGFLAGVVTRGIQIIDGNKQRAPGDLSSNGLARSGASTGAYFAVRGGVRSAAAFLGMSTQLVNIIAVLVATGATESVDIYLKTRGVEKKRVGRGPTMQELMQFEQQPKNGKDGTEPAPSKNELTTTAVFADVTKWVTFETLIPNLPIVPLEISTATGVIAGLVAQLVRESELSREEAKLKEQLLEAKAFTTARKKRSIFTYKSPLKAPSKAAPSEPEPTRGEQLRLRLAQSALEGGIQFYTYEASRQSFRQFTSFLSSDENLLSATNSFLISNSNLPSLPFHIF